MTSARVMAALGWRLTHTNPLQQAFVFERFVGNRRVAMIALTAKSTPRAWRALRRLTMFDKPPRSERARA